MNTDFNRSSAEGAAAQAETPPTKPSILLKVTRNNLELELQFQRTSANTADPEPEEVLAAIAEKGVVYGVKEDNIRQLCVKPVYNNAFVVARGIAPQVGKDGSLRFLVERNRELRPKIREDGTADFKDLGLVQNAVKGQTLCEVYAPEKGPDGCDIFGTVLPGTYGKEASAPVGQNTALNEQKDKVIALVDGNAEYRQGGIHISDVLRIAGNVDNSTGDIDFVGDVVISGYVVSGFKVKSRGNIIVKYGVEGATLVAEGDIIINEGINGMNRGSLIAGGNIKCKYMQSCYIQAQQNIYSETIMYCTLECGGNVELTGKRGTLIGGHASIAGCLIAKAIGTESQTATEIVMASTGMHKIKELEFLGAALKQIDAEIMKMSQIMARFDDLQKKGVKIDQDQMKAVMAVKENYAGVLQRRKETAARMEQAKQDQLEASQQNSFIECKGRVHTGVRFTFGPLVMPVNDSFVNSRVYTSEGEIKISTL